MSRIDPAVILESVRAHVIKTGLASVEAHETRAYRREGCLDGFRLAGALPLNPEPWAELIQEREAFEQGMRRSIDRSRESVEAFWRYRCATAQIEYVRDRLRIVWAANGLDASPDDLDESAKRDVYRHLATLPPELRRSRT